MKKKLLFIPLIAMALGTATGCNKKPDTPVSTDHTVTWDLNYSGAPVWAPTTVKDGVPVSKPTTDPTRDGFVFNTWSTAASSTTAYDFSTPVKADLTLFAQWLEAFNVTFAYNYEGAEEPYLVSQVLKGDLVNKPADPERSGYIFSTWTIGPESTSEEYLFIDEVTSNFTLYAQWADDPEKDFPEDDITDYLGLLEEEPFNVVIPEWEASNYKVKYYADCLLISSPKPGFTDIATYTTALTDAGWVIDPAAESPTAYAADGAVWLQYGFNSAKAFNVMFGFDGNDNNFKRATDQFVYSLTEPSTDCFTEFELLAVKYTNDPVGMLRTYAYKITPAAAYETNPDGAVAAYMAELNATGEYDIKDLGEYYQIIHKNFAFGGWVGSQDGELFVQLCDIYGGNQYGVLDNETYINAMQNLGLIPKTQTSTILPEISDLEYNGLVKLAGSKSEGYMDAAYLNLPEIPGGETETSKVAYWTAEFESQLVNYKDWILDGQNEDGNNVYVHGKYPLQLTMMPGVDTKEGSAFMFEIEQLESEFPADIVKKFVLSGTSVPELSGASAYSYDIDEDTAKLTIKCFGLTSTDATAYITTLTEAGYTLVEGTKYASSDKSLEIEVVAGTSVVTLVLENKASTEFPAAKIAEFIERQKSGDETVLPALSGYSYLCGEEEGTLAILVVGVADPEAAITTYETALVDGGWVKNALYEMFGITAYVSANGNFFVMIIPDTTNNQIAITFLATDSQIKDTKLDGAQAACLSRTGIEFKAVAPTGEGIVTVGVTSVEGKQYTDVDGTNCFEATVITDVQIVDDAGQSYQNTATAKAYGSALYQAYVDDGYALINSGYAAYVSYFFDVYKMIDNGDGTFTVHEVHYAGFFINGGYLYPNATKGSDDKYYWGYTFDAYSYVVAE